MCSSSLNIQTNLPALRVRFCGAEQEVTDGSLWYVIGTDLLIRPPSRLTHTNVKMGLQTITINVNWCSEIRAIINATGYEDNFISKLQCNLEVVKNRIKDKDIESWYSYIRNKCKLRTYVPFKN